MNCIIIYTYQNICEVYLKGGETMYVMIGVAVIVVLALITGLISGVNKKLFNLFGWIATVVLVVFFGKLIVDWVLKIEGLQSFDLKQLEPVVKFAVLTVILLVSQLVTLILSFIFKLFGKKQKSLGNRFAGMGLGILNSLFLITFLFYGMCVIFTFLIDLEPVKFEWAKTADTYIRDSQLADWYTSEIFDKIITAIKK